MSSILYENAMQQVDRESLDRLTGSCAPAPDSPPPKISTQFLLCRYCRTKEINYVTLKREFIAALYAYDTAERLVKLADQRLTGSGKFGHRLKPVHTVNDGKKWEELSSEFGWINWHRFFRDAVKVAEYSMTRTPCCLGCQFVNRIKKARLAIALGEAVKGRRGERGRFEEGVEVLLDDGVRFAGRMMEAGETV